MNENLVEDLLSSCCNPDFIVWEVDGSLEDLTALADRGWKVLAVDIAKRSQRRKKPQDIAGEICFLSRQDLRSVVRKLRSDSSLCHLLNPRVIKLGDVSLLRELFNQKIFPPFIAIRNFKLEDGLSILQSSGYLQFSGVDRDNHPAGGPLAEGLDYFDAEQVLKFWTPNSELHSARGGKMV